MKKRRPRFYLKDRNIAANETSADVDKVQRFLKRFGYLQEAVQSGSLDLPTQRALRVYQKRAGLKITGVIDPSTADKVEEPRCGVPDYGPLGEAFAFDKPPFREGCKYEQVRQLRYGIVKGSSKIGDVKADAEIRAAFDKWEAVIPVDFIKVKSEAKHTLELGFFKDEHGDGFPFHGPGNVLAHAFPPPGCGDPNAGKCHFDDAEEWSDVFGGGFLALEPIALHEIGHLLGLGHLENGTSVMNEFFAKDARKFPPGDPAIPAIQTKYGRRGPSLMVLVHFEALGEQPFRDNELTFTDVTPQRVEGFQVAFNSDRPSELSLRYMAHIDGNDTPFVSEGQFIGIRSQGALMTGFAIELVGSQADKYNVLYTAKIQDADAPGLQMNGEFCGDRSLSKPIEAILVRVEPR